MVDPVREALVEKIDTLVMDAVESDIGNLASVIKLHDKLMEVAEQVSATPYQGLAIIAQKAAEMAMKIVLQETEEPDRTLNLVVEVTSTLQCMAREIVNGRNPAYIPVPESLGMNNDEIFADTRNAVTQELPVPPAVVAAEQKSPQPAAPAASAPQTAAPRYPQFEMGTLTPSHLADFMSEFDDLTQNAEGRLLALEKSQQQEPGSIQELLGVFHTIKGVSGIIKLQAIIQLAHQAEVVLENAQALPRQAADLLFRVVDVFKAYSQSLHHYQEKQQFLEIPATDDLMTALQKIDLQSVEEQKPAAETASKTERVPPAEVPEPEPESEPETRADLQVTEEPAAKDTFWSEAAPEPQVKPQDAGEKYFKTQYGQEEVKIKTDRLDALIDAVGELVIAQSMIENDGEIVRLGQAQTMRNIVTMGKICRQLQELSMSMRMVTIQATFQAMERMVRDLSARQNKEVDVTVSGEYTELDRNVIEAMYNPLVHLVRNAIDHGIETPQQRRALGKPEKGSIQLKAYHRGGNVIIEVRDDGHGLDRDRILRTAVDKGLLRAGQQYSDHEIYQMIFMPGFSTSAQVTEISGRGMGLDVVKKTIEKFRGIVEFFTETDRGTTFRLSLPLTLAIIDGMLVRVDAERYIIPLIHIEEFIHVAPEQISTVNNKGEMLLLRGNVIPVFYLDKLLHIGTAERKQNPVGVIVAWEGYRCCLLVDELINQQQVVIKSLGSDFNKLIGISGCAILGDGRVGLILDIQNILTTAIGTNTVA